LLDSKNEQEGGVQRKKRNVGPCKTFYLLVRCKAICRLLKVRVDHLVTFNKRKAGMAKMPKAAEPPIPPRPQRTQEEIRAQGRERTRRYRLRKKEAAEANLQDQASNGMVQTSLVGASTGQSSDDTPLGHAFTMVDKATRGMRHLTVGRVHSSL
jgi:hypothetical protein